MNKILIIGRLTKDPLLKYTENKKAVVRLNIAVQRPYKSKEGKYEADFIPCVFGTEWRKLLGIIAVRVTKLEFLVDCLQESI